MTRNDGRTPDALRTVSIKGNYLRFAEGSPFSREELDSLIILASNGIEKLTTLQLEAIGKRPG